MEGDEFAAEGGIVDSLRRDGVDLGMGLDGCLEEEEV